MNINEQQIRNRANKTIELEAEAIKKLHTSINDSFVSTVKLICDCTGRIVVTGIGKSALIAQKIVATFNSTGTPALFLHAAEAIHGDIGMIQQQDVVIALSKSGNTPEIKILIPLIKRNKTPLIALVSNPDSTLGLQADFIIPLLVKDEACPHNLAPSSSTAAQMAIGDALAFCVLEQKGFTANDFARLHPGGALGKQLYLRVKDLYPTNAQPKVKPDATIREIILEISSQLLGATVVVDEKNTVLGIITDGDLRRMLTTNDSLNSLRAAEIMTKNPKSIIPEALAVDALHLMNKKSITQLIVAQNGQYLGMIHLHDILKEGII